MKNFTFKPSKRRAVKAPGRNRFIGSWTEPLPKNIELGFTAKNLRDLMEMACRRDSPFSDFDIARWCGSFAIAARKSDDPTFMTVAKVAEDVEAQWDMNLFNTYSAADLPTVDVDSVRLPIEWWTKWLRELERVPGSGEVS